MIHPDEHENLPEDLAEVASHDWSEELDPIAEQHLPGDLLEIAARDWTADLNAIADEAPAPEAPRPRTTPPVSDR